jgi:spore germination cell wall hydrolase CwlJ-like protein
MAVALVVRNRVKEEHKTVCEIAFAERQFSWSNNAHTVVHGNIAKIDPKYIPKKDDKAWIRAQYIAVLSNRIPDFTYGSTNYHNLSVNPKWNLQKTVTIGEHVFYKRIT